SPNNSGVIMQETIARKFEAEFTPMLAICRGPDLDTVMERNRETNRLLDRFVRDGTLRGYESIFNYLPPRQDQEQVIRALRAGQDGTFHIGRIERTFRAALRDNGFREETYDAYLRALPAILRPEKPITIDDLQTAGLERFISRYIKKGEDGSYKSVTYLFPTNPESKRTAPPALVEALDHPEEGVEITGVNIASAELKRIFGRDA